ncbi:MAG: hypothetical protein V5B36_05840 [Candidatus Accumulibacter sp. UW25]|jgi:hypothetical protein
MRRTIIASILGIAMATTSGASFAQFGGITNALGGGKTSSESSSVSAEALVKSYVGGTKQVMSADVNFLNALGLKEQAGREELAAKNLTEGATSSGLEDAAKVQTESSTAMAEAMAAKKMTMSAASKKTYALGLVDLTKGIRSYMAMSSDVKNYKPGLTSIGAAAGAAMYVVKSLPDSITGLKDTLQRAIAFAKENKIEVPADATSLLI